MQTLDAGLVRPSVTYSTLTETILLLQIYNKLHYYISLTLHLPMGIDSHGNKSHSHSHTGCFPFLPIPIPNFVTNSHSHGIPMAFPFPLGIPGQLLMTVSRYTEMTCGAVCAWPLFPVSYRIVSGLIRIVLSLQEIISTAEEINM